ncbi:MAG: amino acid synthesis family protein [Pseudomonadota bacterium]
MADVVVRRRLSFVEYIHHEGGPRGDRTLRRAATVAVLQNPFAGAHHAEIAPFMEALKPLGLAMAEATVDLLGGVDAVQGYGKGALVGCAGEIEHGALWHVPGGYAMREVLGGALAIVPSTKKVCAPGSTLDVPLTHINASYVRSHFDAMEICHSDLPRDDELAVVLVMSDGARIHNRVGGLTADAISAGDGLR